MNEGKANKAYLKAGRSIRLELPDIVGANAAELDGRLGALLNATAPDAETAASIKALLEGNSGARPRFEELFTFYVTGQGGPVGAPEYNCPTGQDCVWFRVAVGTPIPECPTHHVTLTPVP